MPDIYHQAYVDGIRQAEIVWNHIGGVVGRGEEAATVWSTDHAAGHIHHAIVNVTASEVQKHSVHIRNLIPSLVIVSIVPEKDETWGWVNLLVMHQAPFEDVLLPGPVFTCHMTLLAARDNQSVFYVLDFVYTGVREMTLLRSTHRNPG